MAAHVRHERRRRQILMRRPRLFKDRSNPLEDLDAREVFRRYRFKPPTILYILEQILPINLQRPTQRNNPLPPLLQLLVCLRFLATGSMHLLIGDSLNLSRSTAGRCIRDVAERICRLASQHIKFPVGRGADDVKTAFSRIAGFPNVLGCIDGTFIRIQKPSENEADYVNRKGYHALNVQMCCDPSFRVTSCNASWPGSVHDNRVFRTSALCEQFENGHHDGLLLGDSGYACRTFVMTPFLNPATPAEERFNASLARTRVLIEQTFGILKRRFQILHNEIRAAPTRAIIYTTSCVTLHNIGIDRGDIIEKEGDDGEDEVNQGHDRVLPVGIGGGEGVRRHIVETYFA